jgi:hypothetical protein
LLHKLTFESNRQQRWIVLDTSANQIHTTITTLRDKLGMAKGGGAFMLAPFCLLAATLSAGSAEDVPQEESKTIDGSVRYTRGVLMEMHGAPSAVLLELPPAMRVEDSANQISINLMATGDQSRDARYLNQFDGKTITISAFVKRRQTRPMLTANKDTEEDLDQFFRILFRSPAAADGDLYNKLHRANLLEDELDFGQSLKSETVTKVIRELKSCADECQPNSGEDVRAFLAHMCFSLGLFLSHTTLDAILLRNAWRVQPVLDARTLKLVEYDHVCLHVLEHPDKLVASVNRQLDTRSFWTKAADFIF